MERLLYKLLAVALILSGLPLIALGLAESVHPDGNALDVPTSQLEWFLQLLPGTLFLIVGIALTCELRRTRHIPPSQQMSIETFRRELTAFRERADEDSRLMKDPWRALQRLSVMYEGLSDERRKYADQVLSEWVLSEDAGVRFDALALIRMFGIKCAVFGMQGLAAKLARSGDLGAPFELEKVESLIAELTGARPSCEDP